MQMRLLVLSPETDPAQERDDEIVLVIPKRLSHSSTTNNRKLRFGALLTGHGPAGYSCRKHKEEVGVDAVLYLRLLGGANGEPCGCPEAQRRARSGRDGVLEAPGAERQGGPAVVGQQHESSPAPGAQRPQIGRASCRERV